jgi:aspartate/methionine/tyrosine aminotransferase
VTAFERPAASGFAVDPDRIRAALAPRTRVIVLTTPHNPSGVVTSPAVLEQVGAAAAGAGACVLVDEVYRDVAAAGWPVAASLGERFITTGSLSKAYGLASLRCGWTISSEPLAERIRRARDVIDNSGSIVTERLAALAFTQLEVLGRRSRSAADANLAAYRTRLGSRDDLEWTDPGRAAVVFPRLRTINDTARFCRRLQRDRGTAVVPGHFFGAPAHIRIGLAGDHATVAGGLAEIASALDEDAS